MIEDDPEWQVYKRMLQALYRESPARIPVAGSVESISRITAETLYRCHKAFYTPANMCLVAVGDLDAEAVFRAAEDILPPESGPDIPRDYGGSEGDTPAQSETSCRMEVSMPSFLVGFKCPAPPEGEQRLRWDILGDLACDILMGDSSPCSPGCTVRVSSTAPSAAPSTCCPERPTPTPAATATIPLP